MNVTELLRKIEQLEQRLNEVEAENVRLQETIKQKAETIRQLQEILKQYADAKTAKKPTSISITVRNVMNQKT